jgi:hypothetical protein
VSTEELRDELARIGDRAPVVDVADDTFGRAQRARRRDRWAVLGAVAVVLAIAGGLAVWLPDRGEPQPADQGGVGVPSVIHSVPDDALTPTDDLAVGRAAVALMSDQGEHAVVIDAADGTYRALELPGFRSRQRQQGALSLSPDGRQLAWGWAQTQKARAPSGVRILDLVTGEQRSITVPGSTGVFVYAFTWSPDSRWLVWDGAESISTDRNGWAAGAWRGGRIGPGSTTSEPLPPPKDEQTYLAVGDDGEVVMANLEEVTWWDGTTTETRRPDSGWYPVVLTPGEGVLLEELERDGALADDYRVDYRLATPDGWVEAPGLNQISMLVLGLLPDHVVVGQTHAPSQDSTSLSLVDLDAGGTVREVGEITAGRVTVAVDLLTGADPTVDRPDPAWLDVEDQGGSNGAQVAIVVGVLGVLALLGRLWWRRRQALAAR